MTGIGDPESIDGLVSVVVASYNHIEYLERRMESLLAQTYPDIEIIVIDDRSTDGSADFLEKYSSRPNVAFSVNPENLGWVGVSNKGASMAKGEYILFGNCDDFALNGQIERLVEAFRRQPGIAMAFSRSHLVDEDDVILGDDFAGREQGFREFCAGDTVIPGEKMAEFLMHSCVIPNLSAVLMKKSLFLECGGFSAVYRVVADWDLFFKMSRQGDTCWISEPLNGFRQHGETIRATTKERIILRETFDLLDGELDRWKFDPAVRKKLKGDIARKWAKHLLHHPFSSLAHAGFHARMMAGSRFRYSCRLPLTLLSTAWAKFRSLAARTAKSEARRDHKEADERRS